MPISHSAKKALKSSKHKYQSNLEMKKRLKDSVKKVYVKNINQTISMIDKSAKKGLIHPNKAARMKSQLAKKVGSTPKGTDKPKPSKKTKKITKKK